MTDQTYQSKFLVNPESNETFEVTDPQAEQDLLSAGLQPESKEQFVDRTIKGVVKEHPIASTIAAAAGQFTNQFGLGLPQLIYENTGTEEEKAQKKAIDSAITGEHPVANIAGGIGGTAAALLATPLGAGLDTLGDAAVQGVQKVAALGGEKAAAVAASTLAKTAVKYGAENAAINIPYRVTEEMLGDPKIASEGLLAHVAEDFGVGAALGGGVGLGTSLLGYAVKGTAALAKGTALSERLGDVSNQFRFKNAGGLTSDLRQLGKVTNEKSIPERLDHFAKVMDENVDPLTEARGAEAIHEKLLEAKEKTGNQLSGLRTQADALGATVPYQTIEDSLSATRKEYTKGNLDVPDQIVTGGGSGAASQDEILQQAFKRYGTDTRKWPPEVADAISNGTALPGEATTIPGKVIQDPRAGPDVKAIDFYRTSFEAEASAKMAAQGMTPEQIAQAFATGEGLPGFTFNELHNIRQSVKDQLFNTEKAQGFKTDGGTDAWNVVSNLMDTHLDRTFADAGLNKEASIFKKTNAKWREIMQMSDMVLEKATERAVSRNKFGLGSTIFAGAGAIAGGAPGTVAGLAAGYVKQHYGNYIMYQTLGKAAKVLEGFDGRINNAVTEMLSSAPAKAAAKAAAVGSVGVWSRYLGEDKADPRKGLQALVTDLSHAQANPDKVGEALSALAPDLADHAPTNFALMSSNTMAGIQYLMEAAPKPPPPLFPGGPIPPWSPSDNEMSKYSRKVHAIFSPMSILDEVKTGTLTRESVDAVKTVYPNLYQAIQTSLKTKLAGASPRDILRIRSKLSYLIDDGVDPYKKATRIQMNQAGFAPNNKKVAPQANSKIDEASRYKTELDRIQQ